ncbi:MAG TPA: hypothetical protein VLM78_01605, partial [Anaerolineales bacterium]|nr:hypothetical protein [Anaerolineales bacterium]
KGFRKLIRFQPVDPGYLPPCFHLLGLVYSRMDSPEKQVRKPAVRIQKPVFFIPPPKRRGAEKTGFVFHACNVSACE